MYNKFFLIGEGITLFFLSVLGTYAYCRYARARGLLDIPNARSSHQAAVPRGGGSVFVMVWLIAAFLAFFQGFISQDLLLWFLPAAFCFALLGYWDDTQSLSVRKRLVLQFVLSLALVQGLGRLESLHLWNNSSLALGWFGVIIGLFTITWSVNLFNFMDGLDGLAAIEAFFVLGFGGLLCWQGGATDLAFLAWGMVVVVAGFLVWNWPKASVFMGDAGSYCLGLLIALCAIVGERRYQIPITLWLILYGAFWFDATVTLIRRMLLKKNWTAAHREHAYQRLHQSGLSHQQVLWAVIVLNSLLASLALWANQRRDYLWLCLLIAIVLLTIAYVWVERLKPLQTEKV